MANREYPIGMKQFADGEVDWLLDTIRVSVVSSTYTFSIAHDFYDDVTGVLAVGTLAGKTDTDGIMDADDLLITGITGTPDAVVVHKWSGVSSTSPLLFYFDDGPGIGIALAGEDFKIIWDNNVSIKIFPLGGRRT